MNPNDILSSEEHELDYDFSFRPRFLGEFVGQEHIKSNLMVFIGAAKNRQEPLDHTLFYGPPGLGKTSLAQIIAKEMDVSLKSASGPALSKPADLAAILTNLQNGDVLFIDEIHRLNVSVEELLYSAMEDFAIDIIIGAGPAARSVRLSLAKFTLVGATTRLGLLSKPLRDRFGIPLRLDFYKICELKKIIARAGEIVNVIVGHDGLEEIAKRSRGTPRIALRLFKRIRDFALIEGVTKIDRVTADKALSKLEVDRVGLDSNDHRYLKFIVENYNGGPVGVETIAAALSEERDSIEEAIEPYLIQIGMLQRTSRGRVITRQALIHLGLDLPEHLVVDEDKQREMIFD